MDIYGKVYKYPTMSMAVDRGHLLDLHRQLIDELRAEIKRLNLDAKQHHEEKGLSVKSLFDKLPLDILYKDDPNGEVVYTLRRIGAGDILFDCKDDMFITRQGKNYGVSCHHEDVIDKFESGAWLVW
jgi:hypothetical protein